MIPTYLLSSTGCEHKVVTCMGCPGAVKKNKATGRWFITMGHPGFNSETNNGAGYKTREAAVYAVFFYAGKSARPAGVSNIAYTEKPLANGTMAYNGETAPLVMRFIGRNMYEWSAFGVSIVEIDQCMPSIEQIKAELARKLDAR